MGRIADGVGHRVILLKTAPQPDEWISCRMIDKFPGLPYHAISVHLILPYISIYRGVPYERATLLVMGVKLARPA